MRVAYLCLFVVLSSTACAQRCTYLADPSTASYAYHCKKQSFFDVYPHVWSPSILNITCTSEQYEVHTGSSVKDLENSIEQMLEPAWCGWGSFWHPKSCFITIPPYQEKFISVSMGAFPGGVTCERAEQQSFTWWLPVLGAVGAWLFLNAQLLSTSTAFRLSSGTALFTSMSLAILVIFLMRAMPHKKQLMVALLTMGSTTMSMMRWLYGKWLPSFGEIVHSRVFFGYLILSGLVGMVLTYYFDNTKNEKLNNIIRVGLQALGLLAVYHSTTSTATSLLLVFTLLVVQVRQWWLRSREPFESSTGFMFTPPRVTPIRSPNQIEARKRAMLFAEAAANATPNSNTPPPGQKILHFKTPPPHPSEIVANYSGRHAPSPYQPYDPARGGQPPNQPTATPTRTEMSDESVDIRSPLVRQGKIVNQRTGKTIKIGGVTFNTLVNQGYAPDYVSGVITPPAGVMNEPQPSRASGAGRRRPSYTPR